MDFSLSLVTPLNNQGQFLVYLGTECLEKLCFENTRITLSREKIAARKYLREDSIHHLQRMQHLTLAQQIAQLEDTVPADYDPEDIYGGNANDRTHEINGGDVEIGTRDLNIGREHYMDVGPSELRKLQDSIVDSKYDSVKTSRDKLLRVEPEEEGVSSESDHMSGHPSTHGDSLSSAEEDKDEEDHAMPKSLKKHRKSPTQIQDKALTAATLQDEGLTSSLQRTRVADKLKGKAVSAQLKIWDSLVDARIRLQKSISAANKLPHPENLPRYVSSAVGRSSTRSFLAEALQLSEELFELRTTFLENAGANPPRKKRRIDTEQDDLDYEALIQESTTDMVNLDMQTHADTLSTLQKWSAKVQAVTPAALLPSTRISFNSGPARFKSAGELVEDILREQDKVVKRTWCRSDRVARIGGRLQVREGEEDEGDEETFDDRDFYQAMLRDVIESKGEKDGVDATDLYANSRRQRKKKIVDTKASKGRKLRYESHEKLQNFMVPVSVRNAWHEEQIDELFASLLGKGFEGADSNQTTNRMDTLQTNDEVFKGFKIFG